MYIFKAKGLEKEFNGKTIFENIDLELKSGEHVALFGRNGTGKTTLLAGLSGQISVDAGTIQRFVPVENWSVLEQDPIVESFVTTHDFVLSGSGDRFLLKKELEQLQYHMENEHATENMMNRYNRVYQQFLQADGYHLETEAESALQQVGLGAATWMLPYHHLSGGQKTRAQLARLMINAPSCIIMDEPTNHLDKETMEWLEQWLRDYNGAALFVSHDRTFIDRTAHALYELNPGGCTRYTGNYSAYRRQKALERQTQETLYHKQERERKELLQTIQNYQKWAHQAHDAAGTNDFLRAKAKKNVSRFKAKEMELERLEKSRVQKPQDEKQVNFGMDQGSFSARRLLQLEDVTFSYDNKKSLFFDVTLTVKRGDRIGIIGPNGSGKSTLLKLMVGNLSPGRGEIKLNPQTKIGYFAQELEALNENEAILDSMLSLPGMTQSEARTILGCFLFSRDEVFKRIGDLSMGEKCRVAFIHLYFSDANLLVLDEPTNFLDVDTKEVIEDVLQTYPGALIVVSHDRYLIRKVSNRIIELGEAQMIDFDGTYEAYLEHKAYVAEASDPNEENTIRELELRLTRLMGTETGNPEEQEEILAEIKEIRQQLDALR